MLFFDLDDWDEIDTMTDLDGTGKMFDGESLEPAARTGGTFHTRLGPKVQPHQYFRRRPVDAGCRE